MTLDLIALATGGALVPGRRYHSPLPPELEPWYCYTADGGHSIVVAVRSRYEQPGADPGSFLIPAPVRTVMRALDDGRCVIDRGYLVADLYFHPHCGLVTPADDDEF